jgi:hypothetical protein
MIRDSLRMAEDAGGRLLSTEAVIPQKERVSFASVRGLDLALGSPDRSPWKPRGDNDMTPD